MNSHKEMESVPKERLDLKERLEKISMLLFDVDGVLTDGGIIFGDDDQEFKRFNIQDGMGVTLARAGGLKVGIITGRKSASVERRAHEMHVDELYQGNDYKIESYHEILEIHSLSDDAVCYIGDDVLDLPILERVGVAVAVANAREEVKQIAHIITHAKGGEGAVREVVDLILKTQHKWDTVLHNVLTKPL